ncbi:hypothetical protein AN396_04020 [Candidatus Epulonipiscium fishelsonii]|uniref:Uncharacterized protein n=1 Tax=Candidatus Epulonipiscium fishelsonii TaxID=77094 RepID=A0ACC8XE36_9FIRM|nr:hypothetical protein AN396_04020 [Epulopiscium sp. SCG-B11WGA-EpuloA1]
MAIGAIGGTSPSMYTTRLNTQQQQQSKVVKKYAVKEKAQEKFASGKRINSAAQMMQREAIAQIIFSHHMSIDM